MIGADIGTQTVAYTSDTEVGLKNLSERGRSIQKSERLERLYYRAMDRSRLILRIIMKMVLLKKAARPGDILIIIRS